MPSSFHHLENQKIFLNKVDAQIKAHLLDPSFNVKILTRNIGMSRTDLHRKLKKSVGMSTTEYIRYIRLTKAADLLLQDLSLNIGEIAQRVGFNNSCYFAKRFREVFSISPLQFRQQSYLGYESEQITTLL